MYRKLIAAGVAIAGFAISACGGRMASNGALGGGTVMLPPIENDLFVYATLPKHTIGEELPSEGVGQIKDPKWKAMLGGFTQTSRSQALGFPPGTKITIHNMSKKYTHTLDVVKVIQSAPAVFPSAAM